MSAGALRAIRRFFNDHHYTAPGARAATAGRAVHVWPCKIVPLCEMELALLSVDDKTRWSRAGGPSAQPLCNSGSKPRKYGRMEYMASAPRRAEAPARLSGPHSTLCPARPAFWPSRASPRRAARTGSRTRQPGRRCGARTTAPYAARARRAGSSGTRPSTGPDLSSARCHPRPPLPRAAARPSPPRAGRRGSGSRGGRGRARTSAAPSCRPGTQTRAPLAAPPPGPV